MLCYDVVCCVALPCHAMVCYAKLETLHNICAQGVLKVRLILNYTFELEVVIDSSRHASMVAIRPAR